MAYECSDCEVHSIGKPYKKWLNIDENDVQEYKEICRICADDYTFHDED